MNNWSSVLFLFLSIFLITNTSGFAQKPVCTVNTIELSRDSYEIGEFASVKRNLQACVRSQNFEKLDDLNQARELLALTAIVEDSSDVAKEYIKLIVSSNSNFSPKDKNIVFKSILDEVKRENSGVRVSSVSKKAEDLNKAPATVRLVTHEEIIDRGYKDLIEVLSDLPGFDITKTFSLLYANVNQLGFRQEDPEETLFMIDGVEEND
uniref:TonB-dependent receptor plug domain-containing protein n=1 Tax=Flavobacterium sp. TaxID=239 RepID=UPI00404B46FC